MANWEQISGSWKEFKGSVQQRWGELTGDEVDEINGDRERLEGKLEQKYGKAKEDIRRDIDDWLNRL